MNSTEISREEFDAVKNDLDSMFLLINALFIIFMQAGFAFLEIGSVRINSVTNVLFKNVLDCFLGAIVFWLIGFGIAFGESSNGFIGGTYFASYDLPHDMYAFWVFQFTFAATTSTIVSGAVAERCRIEAYLLYSVLLTGFIYPVVVHWAWSGTGWLTNAFPNGAYQDFAGAGVVHCVGGAAALAGAYFIGPRVLKFSSSLRGHSVPFTSLGAFILFTTFLAFNGGSNLTITGPEDGYIVANVIKNTILSGAFSCVTCVIIFRFMEKRWSLIEPINAALSGMVASCAGCNVLYNWGAAITGGVAGVIYTFGSSMLKSLNIDDPLSASAVHFFAGFWGVVSQPILKKDGILCTWTEQSFIDFGINLLGVTVITLWSLVVNGGLFYLLSRFDYLRLPESVLEAGIDETEHKEPAYSMQNISESKTDLSMVRTQ